MEDLQELRRQHAVFAKEAFNFLMYNCQVERECLKNFKCFKPSVGDAIFVISYIFKKDYWKTFNRLHENLKHVKMFEKYCMIIPVKKDERYFYNFLKRISLIFELSMYCYNEGFNYFKIGRKCLSEYEDLKFFESSGGWTRLEHAAQFIARLGRPLTLIMNRKYLVSGTNIATFTDAVREVRKKFMLECNTEMLDSKEMYCLEKLGIRLKAHAKAVKTKIGLKVKTKGVTEYPQLAVADSKQLNHDLEKEIKSYFRECFSCLVPSMEIPNDNLENASLNCTASVPAEDYPETECLLKVVSETMAVLSIESHPNPENKKFRERSTAQKGCNNEPESEYLNKDSEDSLQNVSNLDTDKRGENELFLPVEVCDLITGMKVDSLAEMKQHVDEYVTPYPTSSSNSDGYSSLHMENKINIQLENLSDNSLKCTETVPTKYYSMKKCFENILPKRNVSKTVDADQHSKNDKLDKTLIAPEECYNQPTFIVPQQYLDLRESDESSKCKHLYSVKMCPPSIRKKLDGHLKKILDENIESQNYNKMPSGDIHVCPLGSSLEVGETLVIFAESSTDEEGDPDIDTLTCLFKKMEIDSQGKESGYSLRPRLPKLREKQRLKDELDSAENVTKETTVSNSGSTSKFPRRTKHKSPGTNLTEMLYAKVLIRLYKKYFASFLDKYFKTDFPIVETEIQSTESLESLESNSDTCKYVFAVSARIMAKRKVHLDDPDESKRVLAFQMHGDYHLKILPLPLQKLLDSQIRNRNYYVAVDGIYGVGPRHEVEKENVWVILCSDDWLSHSFDLRRVDVYEILETFRSYEPVLQIALPLGTKIDMVVLQEVIDMQLRGRT